MEKCEIGEVVQLNSGGPKMTVYEFDSNTDECTCRWFSGDKPMEKVFKKATLRSITAEEKRTIHEFLDRGRQAIQEIDALSQTKKEESGK